MFEVGERFLQVPNVVNVVGFPVFDDIQQYISNNERSPEITNLLCYWLRQIEEKEVLLTKNIRAIPNGINRMTTDAVVLHAIEVNLFDKDEKRLLAEETKLREN